MACEKHGYTNNVICPACDLETVERLSGNTPIEKLLAHYTEECCDFTDIAWVKKTALRHASKEPDSLTRCLLYILASS